MKAARLYAPGDLRIEEVPIPTAAAGEVLVKVGACGICGSDVPRIATTGTYHYPTVPGHEFMGQITEAGQGVDRALVGRRAAVIPLIGCGSCDMCRSGLPFHCGSYDFLGSRSDGGFAEYVVVPVGNLILLDDNVSDVAGAMVEPAAVGLHCVRRPGVDAGDTVVVFGAGAIGLFASQWARELGAGSVIQVDIREESLEVARKCGIARTTNALVEDVVEKVMALTNGRGADMAVEAAGSPASTADSFRCVRRRGRVSLIGRIDADWNVPEDVLTGLLRKEQVVFGNWGFDSGSFPANDWEVAARALHAGRIAAEPLVSHTVGLDELNSAVAMMAENKEYFCKVMVVPRQQA